jgi:sporulation protein YlmC with PRC-barrel domain
MYVGQGLLDQQVIDRSGQQMGKVDGVFLEIRKGRPPRVSSLVIGGGTAAHRLHPGFGRWLLRWRRRWGPTNDAPLEIPSSKVLRIGVDIKVDLESEGTPALAWEQWIRRYVIGRIPGA